MLQKHLYFVVCIFLSHLAVAQEKADSLKERELPSVMVVALRQIVNPQTAPVQLAVLEKSVWTRNVARTTPEALIGLNGVWLQKTNHGGGSPFLRGLTGNQTLHILDGIRLNNSVTRYGPNQYLNTIDLFSLDKVEVLYNEGAVRYGSDAFGGTLSLISDVPKLSEVPKINGSLLSQWTSDAMERSLRAKMQYQSKRVAFGGGFTARHFGDLRGGDTTGVQSPTGYREAAYEFGGSFKASKRWEITTFHRNLAQDNVPVYHKVALEKYQLHTFDKQARKVSWIKNNWELPFEKWKSIFVTFARQISIEDRHSQKLGSNLLRTEADRVRTYSAIIQSKYQTGRQSQLDFGAESYLDLVQSSRADMNTTNQNSENKRGLYPNGSKMVSTALFGVHKLHFRHWIIMSGLRFNTVQIRMEDRDLGMINVRPQAIVGTFGITHVLNRRSNVFASINSGFRSPNIDDLGSLGLVDFRYELPNYNLKPEFTRNVQAGFRHNSKVNDFSICLYHNGLRNLITRVQKGGDSLQGYPVYVKVNSGRGYIYGGEIQYINTSIPDLTCTAMASYAFGQDLSLNEPMRRIPPLNGQLSVQYQPNRWFVKIQALGATKQNRLSSSDISDNRIPNGGTPGWAITNLSGGYTTRFWELNAHLHNISNADYRYHGSGVNGIGRAVSVGMKLQFGRALGR